MPAFSRSQVSAVIPSLRSRCFWTFCVGVLGSAGHDADVARHHEVRHARRQESDQLGRIERRRRRRATTATSTSSSPSSLGTATAAASLHRRMGADLGLDLERGDVLAAAADRVLHAVDEEVVAVLVRRGRRRRCGTSRCARPAPSPRDSCSSRGSSPRAGRCARSARRPSPGATSQSFSSTTRTSTPGRGRPQVPSGAGFGAETDRRRDLGHVEDGVDVAAEALGERGSVLAQRHHDGAA